MSKTVPLKKFRFANTLKEKTVPKPSSQIEPPIMTAACARVRLNRSTSHATAGSISPSADVHAANDSRMKNRVEKNAPPGICPRASGKVWNTRPGPSAGSRPFAKTSGNITSPASIAMSVSAVTTAPEAPMIEVSSGR